MLDNLFVIRDVCDVWKLYNVKVGIISIDQEKAFDRVDHDFLFSTLQAFGVRGGSFPGSSCFTVGLAVW